MDRLVRYIGKLEGGGVRDLVDKRMAGFRMIGRRGDNEFFKELCFCILTANFNAERSIKIQDGIGDGFLTLPESRLRNKLKALGHRYPDIRARYIIGARKHKDSLKQIIDSFDSSDELRKWLDGNIRGIGYKEASHFLRNIGFSDVAIIDFHIIDILVSNRLIERPKTLTKKKYLEIEGLLKEVGRKCGLGLGELDLYLWFSETGKILK